MPRSRAPRVWCCAAAVLWTACGEVKEAPQTAAGYADSEISSDSLDAEPATGADFLDPNLATAAALTALPGMTDSVTLAVIAGRPYRSMIALDRVLARHLSAQWRDSVYAHLWMPLDLNTASSEEILLIPGVDTRLRHALEEHRPYEGMDHFRREIGAEAGDGEAARLARFIRVP